MFHEQTDGRKVARLPGGKVVLVDLQQQVDRVREGEAWFVRLRHRESFAIAEPVERVTGGGARIERRAHDHGVGRGDSKCSRTTP